MLGLSSVYDYVKNFFGRPTQSKYLIEENEEEHHTESKKRKGDFLNSDNINSFPSKKICLGTPIAGHNKHDQTTKFHQCLYCKQNNRPTADQNDNYRSASESPDFTTGRGHWHDLDSTSTPTSIPRPHSQPIPVDQTKIFDNKMYTPPTPSVDCDNYTIYREGKNHYSEKLKQYFDKNPQCGSKPTSTTFENTSKKPNEVPVTDKLFVVSFTKFEGWPQVKFYQLKRRMKEQVPTAPIWRAQEIHPQTLAFKLAEIAKTYRPEAQTSRVNSYENMLNLCSSSQPFVDEVLTKFEKRNRESPQFSAEEYSHRINKMHVEPLFPDDVFEDEVPELPKLLPSMQEAIEAALIPNPPLEVLVQKFSLEISRHDINTLNNNRCLNDAIINFYLNLLIERGQKETFPSVYAFNTFFYGKLKKSGFSMVKRWTKRIDVFSYDLIIVPVHLPIGQNNHWCTAAIDFREKTIKYFDSTGSPNNQCLNALLQYLEEESIDKKQTLFDTSSWKKINVKDIPQQTNIYDCGVFACVFSEYICRDAEITFTHEDMPYFRRKMVFEIIDARLLEFPSIPSHIL